jgi:thioredoxin
VVVQFSATWCGPCRILTKTIEANEESLSVRFVKINLDNAQDLAAKYNVRAVPTLILFDNEQEVSRVTGNKTLTQLRDFIS